MVSFRTLATAALAAFSTPVFGALTPAQMVDNIRTLTSKSQALQAPAGTINVVNAPLIVVGQGPLPQIIAGFNDIVSTATSAIVQMQGTPKIQAGAESDAIYDAFREFVRVHQVLLNILIGKAGVLNLVPFIGEPVAAVLRSVENVVDTIAFGLIDNVESRSADLRSQAESLSMTLTTAIKSYSGDAVVKRETRDERAARAVRAAA